MKKCNSCNIKFNINSKYCPLCQNILTGKNSNYLFPKNIRYESNSLILKILLFSSISIFLIFSFIELLVSNNINLSLYMFLGLVTNYIIIYYILKKHQDIYKKLNKYGFLIIFLLIVWYVVTRSKVITNYIIPSVCLFELLFNLVIGIILRKNYLIKYTRQIIINIFLLLLPIILVIFKQTSNNIMSYICCLLSIISLSGLLIFFFEDIKDELSKLFNI